MTTDLNGHHDKLRKDVGEDDLDREHSCDPGPLQETLGPLGDEGLRGERHADEEERAADHARGHKLPETRVLVAEEWSLLLMLITVRQQMVLGKKFKKCSNF